MTQLRDIMSPVRLAKEIIDGMITARSHPEFPELTILNYTPKAAYANHWNTETSNSRGLIYNAETMRVLARPFSKFFNYGQVGAPDIDLDAQVYWVGDKADGSLGIGYVRPDGRAAIATRGSFTSEQAIHATVNLTEEWQDLIKYWGESNITELFEIVYPENRIVIDYGDRDELIHLGTVRIENGEYLPPPWIASQTFWSLRDVLNEPPRPNAEGYVVWLDPFTAIKLKQDDYVELHRIVTGLNRKSIWRKIQEGPHEFELTLESLPDELTAWAEGVAKELNYQYGHEVALIDAYYLSLLDYLSPYDEIDRKEFALAVQKFTPSAYRPYMFLMLDGRDISAKLWASLEPVGGDK